MRLLIFMTVIILCLSARQSSAKTKRTLMTDEQVQQARANVANYDWAKKSLEDTKKSVDWVLMMSDEELWDFIPPAHQPRALNVRFGFDCPIHGKEIFKKGGHYPWIIDREHPFKLKCPVGGEVYPTNDFQPWTKDRHPEPTARHPELVSGPTTDRHPELVSGPIPSDTTTEYVDDGYGWADKDGNRYWFVGYYVFWQRWRADILPTIPRLAYVYALTGDTRYSHKAAVMLARIASEYPDMVYAKQAYHNGAWPAGIGGKILDHCWEGGGTIEPLSIAYDEIYDGIAGDAALKTFLSGKGITDAKALIEADFLQEAAKVIQSGMIQGNMNCQQQLAIVARVLDNDDPVKGYTTEQMIDWIMNGGGEMATLIVNGVSRDGAASEESIGYTSIWTDSFLDLGKRLQPMGVELFSNPRLKKMVDFYIQTAVADKFSPCIGDSHGDMSGGAPPVWSASMMRKAYDIWGDPQYARVLNRVGWPSPLISEDPEALEAAKRKAKALGTDLGLKTRDLGGYGLAILESGEGDNKRAATLYYGSSGAWHGHLDRLNIGMWAHEMCMLPEMGYPAHWGTQADLWCRSTPTHYCVQIDENCQTAKREGRLNLLASGDGVQVMDASGEDAYRSIASQYRRTVAMIDASDEDSYLLDIFRVEGGKTHDYIFHGLPHAEFSTSGLALGPPQSKGTLMGEDIEFGKTFDGMKTGGYQYLSNVRRAGTEDEWSVNWLLKDKKLGLRITMPAQSASEVIVADGVPEPAPGNPEKMEYVIARNETLGATAPASGSSAVAPRTGGATAPASGSDAVAPRTGSSTFISVAEPYKDRPFVRRVTTLKPTDNREDLAAVRVDAKGRADYILSATEGARTSTLDDGKIEFAGEFGAISEDNSGILSMMLVNGSILRRGDVCIRVNTSPHAKIASVDYQANTITLDRAVAAPNALIGQVVVISNPNHGASFTVKSVASRNGCTVLGFGDISMIEGIGVLKSVDDKANTVHSGNRLGGYGIKWEGKSIPGRALVNEALTDSWPITDYDSGIWHVKASEPISTRISTNNGKPSMFFYVGEVCVGDDIMLPSIVGIRREGEGYAVRATAPFVLLENRRSHEVTAGMLSKNNTLRID